MTALLLTRDVLRATTNALARTTLLTDYDPALSTPDPFAAKRPLD